MKKQQQFVCLIQDITIAFVLLFFAFDYSTKDYTDFSESPPTISDKIWYVGEAILFALFALVFAVLNNALQTDAGWNCLINYQKAWTILARFLFLRTTWEILWVITGMSANFKIAQAILFSAVMFTIFCITYLPYLKMISNKKR